VDVVDEWRRIFALGRSLMNPSTYMYSIHRYLQSTIGASRLLEADSIGFLFEFETIITSMAMTLSKSRWTNYTNYATWMLWTNRSLAATICKCFFYNFH
jgi:hypothetical protein